MNIEKMSLGYNRRLVCGGLLFAWLGLSVSPRVHAEIVMGGRDTSGTIDNSGTNKNPVPFSMGQYIGDFGGYLGTAISSHYFVTANHIGDAGNGQFIFDNGTSTSTTYNVTEAGVSGDLAIWKISDTGAFSLYAPLYFGSNETGQALVSVGNGTSRGGTVYMNSQFVGWADGSGTTNRSWQTNTVSAIDSAKDLGNISGFSGDFLQFDFNRQVDAQGNLLNPDTGIFSGGDSGGPTFVLDPVTNTYELDGINSLVDTVSFTSNGTAVSAAIFDARGYYSGPDLITGNDPVPLSSYATRISSQKNFFEQTLGNEFALSVPEPGPWILLSVFGITGGAFARRARQKRA